MNIKFLRFFIIAVFVWCSIAVGATNQLGDTVVVDGKKIKLVSDNLITNPGFENGFTGWTDATSSAATLSSAKFKIQSSGGVNNSRFLVGLNNEGSTSSGSIGTGWSIESGKSYLFAYQVKSLKASSEAGSVEWLKVSLTNDKTSNAEPLILLNEAQLNANGEWTQNYAFFTNSNPSFNYIVARFRWLSNLYGFDDFMLYEAVEVVSSDVLQAVINEAEALYDSTANGAVALQSAIDIAKTHLENSSSSEVQNAIDDLEAAILSFKYANTSELEPMDLTHFIQNPNFDANTTTGWLGGGTVNYHEVEYYQQTFDFYQTISGLPAGKYVLTVQGFERPKSNDAGVAYKAGSETISAKLYAQSNGYAESVALFKSLYQHTYSGGGSLNGYINNMSAAESFMTSNTNNYKIELANVYVEDGESLTIGVRSDFQQSGYWTLFDNFRLTYLGVMDIEDIATALESRMEEAQQLLSEHIQGVVADSLTNVVEAVRLVLDADSLVEDDIMNAKTVLDSTLELAYLSYDAYKELAEAVETAAVKMTFLEKDDEITRLQEAIDIANAAYQNTSLTVAQVNNAIAALNSVVANVGKKIYESQSLGNLHDPNNNWYLGRSMESKDWIVLWEDGLGDMTSTAEQALEIAERAFNLYTDSLKFIKRGNSKTDDYKMFILIPNTSDWVSNGSGIDNMIGLCTMCPSALLSRNGQTLAHETGHCFQYQVHCDNNDNNGFMYGFGTNGSGGNGYWENCAQWQAYKVFPQWQFGNEWYNGYLSNVHKHPMHEAPRYENFFLQDFWCYKHGMDFIGRLWNESYSPEDPIQAYMRITDVSLSEFNDEIWECAARFATWDVPALKSYGASYISSRTQPGMTNTGNYVWRINESVCPENFGHNIIRLNTPSSAKTVTVYFEGLAGMDGYRSRYVYYGGWRYGFVALLRDGTRVYSDIAQVNMSADGDDGKGELSFNCPDNCSRLYLVVSGAPTNYWRHAWDDDDSNDEQWPYQVTFDNSNLYGHRDTYNAIESLNESELNIYSSKNMLIVDGIVTMYSIRIFNVQGVCLLNTNVGKSMFKYQLEAGIYVISVNTLTGVTTRKIVIP